MFTKFLNDFIIILQNNILCVVSSYLFEFFMNKLLINNWRQKFFRKIDLKVEGMSFEFSTILKYIPLNLHITISFL